MRGALRIGAVLLLTTATACTFVRSLDYLTNGGPETEGGIAPTPDGAVNGPDAATASFANAVPVDVTPNAVILQSDGLYVAGAQGPHGWVGHFDATTGQLLGSGTVDLAGASAVSLLAIAASPDGFAVAGRADDGAVIGSFAADLTDGAVHAVAAPTAGPALFHDVGVSNGTTFASGDVIVSPDGGADGGPDVQGWFAAGDTACPPPQTTNDSTAEVVRIKLAFGGGAIVFATRADRTATYARYPDQDCTRESFPDGGIQNDIRIVGTPEVFTATQSGRFLYAAGRTASGAGSFFIGYDDITGMRVNTDYSTLNSTPSTFVASAHDGDAMLVVGELAGTESVVIIGSGGGLAPSAGPKETFSIIGYSARGIATQPSGQASFYLVGGADHGYLVRCDKTNGCPATAP